MTRNSFSALLTKLRESFPTDELGDIESTWWNLFGKESADSFDFAIKWVIDKHYRPNASGIAGGIKEYKDQARKGAADARLGLYRKINSLEPGEARVMIGARFGYTYFDYVPLDKIDAICDFLDKCWDVRMFWIDPGLHGSWYNHPDMKWYRDLTDKLQPECEW